MGAGAGMRKRTLLVAFVCWFQFNRLAVAQHPLRPSSRVVLGGSNQPVCVGPALCHRGWFRRVT